MSEIYANGELFVYCNGDRWELGQVKSSNNTGDGYFCWYSTGDTAANTPVRCMHKLANAGWSHVERTCTIEHRRDEYVCTACGNAVGDDDPWSENFVNGNAVEMWAYCPHCGAKVTGGAE